MEYELHDIRIWIREYFVEKFSLPRNAGCAWAKTVTHCLLVRKIEPSKSIELNNLAFARIVTLRDED